MNNLAGPCSLIVCTTSNFHQEEENLTSNRKTANALFQYILHLQSKVQTVSQINIETVKNKLTEGEGENIRFLKDIITSM